MNRIANSMIWRLVQQYGNYIVKLVLQTVLARLLLPAEYGVIAKVLVFVSIAETMATAGLGTALIQKENPDKKDYGTSLVASIVLAFILYIVLFISAPVLAVFYDNPEITIILRVYGVLLPINAYACVQNAYISKAFAFKESCLAATIATILSGGIAVAMAYTGLGVWALVAQSLIASVVTIFVLHILTPWKPILFFDIPKFKEMFSFSWKILASGLLGNLLENIYNLSLGKTYGDAILGYYNRGNAYPAAIIGQTRNAISAVTLPAFSEIQNDMESLRNSIKKITRVTTFAIFPMMTGLIAVAEPMVSLLLTDKWLPCVFFMRLECVFYGMLPLSTTISNGLTAIGKSEIALRVESFKLFLTLMAILLIGDRSVYILCIVRLLISVVTILYSVLKSRKLIGYGFKNLFGDTYKALTLSCIMGVVIYAISLLSIPLLPLLLMQVVAGVLFYIIGARIFMKDELLLLLRMISRKR